MLRQYFTKLRLSLLPLRITTGRYGRERIEMNLRYCLCCNKHGLEDNFHCICIFPCFVELRRKCLPRYYVTRPSMFKFIELLKCENNITVRKISMFTKYALELRTAILSN